MLQFFQTYGGSILVGLLVLSAAALAAAKLYRDRRKGKSSCGGGCAHCPSAGACHGNTIRIKSEK